jgi:hypothetical protein
MLEASREETFLRFAGGDVVTQKRLQRAASWSERSGILGASSRPRERSLPAANKRVFL